MIPALLLLLTLARAQSPPPPVLERIGVEEHLGASVPLELAFVDHTGAPVTLGQHVVGDAPVLLVLAYYDCPMLCDLVLRGVATAAADVGVDWRAVTVSFDPTDTPADAAAARKTTLELAGRAEGWPFLVGRGESAATLARSLGYRYEAVDDGQYAHPAVFFVLTPDGRVSRYLYGTRPTPLQVQQALEEAAVGGSGTSFGGLVQACFRFVGADQAHAAVLQAILRGGGVAIFGGVGALLAFLWLREWRS